VPRDGRQRLIRPPLEFEVVDAHGDTTTPLLTLRHVALRLERFLRLSRDPQELVGLLCPDFESFWWSSPDARALGRDVYGF
jgi:hypothetical protein